MSGSQPKITNFFLCQNNAAANKAPSTVAESPTKPAPRRSKLSLKHKNVAAISNDRGKRLKPDPARCSNGSDLKERAPQDACQASASAESVPECCTAQVLRGGTSGTEKSPVVGADSSETTVLETDSAERAATEPRVPYYLENLVLIVNSVMSSDDWRLFSDEEKQMFATFLDADEKCQKLLARLLQRKHIWRKASKITYPDIAENLESVLLALQEKGYLEDVAHLNDLATTMSLLSPMETKSLAQMFRLKTSGRGKGNLAESLLEHCSKQQSVLAGSPRNTLEQLALKKALSLLGAAWRLRDEPRDAWRRLLRLFSLGTPWDGEEAGETPQVYGLQLVSAGKMAFPEYQVWRKDILFAEREDLIR
ncbi:fanconi-associated nuclease 1 isoform X2 [Ixodes scapularis]